TNHGTGIERAEALSGSEQITRRSCGRVVRQCQGQCGPSNECERRGRCKRPRGSPGNDHRCRKRLIAGRRWNAGRSLREQSGERETREVRFAPLTEKAKEIGSDERAETVRDDDDSVVGTSAVVLAAGVKMVKESTVAFDDFRARRGARGRGAKVVVHVQNGVENGTQVFDEQTGQNSGRAGKNSAEGEQLTAALRHERQLI